MTITELHKDAKSLLKKISRLVDATCANRPELERDLAVIQSDLLHMILDSGGDRFLIEHASQLYRSEGSPVFGFYNRFVGGLRHFLCLDGLALFATTSDDPAPLLSCVALAATADTDFWIKGICLDWPMVTNSESVAAEAFSVEATRAKFFGPGLKTLPRSSRIVWLPVKHRVRAALLYYGDRPEWLPKTYANDLISKAGTCILFPQLLCLHAHEQLAGGQAFIREIAHAGKNYIRSSLFAIKNLQFDIDRRAHSHNNKKHYAETIKFIHYQLEKLLDLFRATKHGRFEWDTQGNPKTESSSRRDRRS